jgi:hypothetical protein
MLIFPFFNGNAMNTETLNGYKGYVIDVGARFDREVGKWVGYYRVDEVRADKSHGTIYRGNDCDPDDLQKIAESNALKAGENYVDRLLPK